MATTQDIHNSTAERSEKVIAGTSVLELVAGAAAVVLPILGLVGVYPIYLASIAFIAIGAGMMSQGGGASVQARSWAAAARGGDAEAARLVGGMSAEVLGGAAIVALGILALLRLAPLTLLASAAIVGGAALVLCAGDTSRMSTYRYGAARQVDDYQRVMLRDAVKAAAGADVLAGLASIVLGILTLANVGGPDVHRTLVLVAPLALGGALFLNGTTMGARMGALLSS